VAFIGGVFPLVVATGAGAEMRQSLGTAVFSGMIGVALFGIFLTPVFFFVLTWLGSRKQALVPATAAAADGSGPSRLSADAVRGRSTGREENRASENAAAPSHKDGHDGAT
jgi:multidrug efflux pump